MASLVGSSAKQAFAKAQINWESADIRVALSTGYSFNVDTDQYLSAITNECVGTGYVRKALTTKTATLVTGGVQLKADDATWTGANFGSPAVAVIYLYNAGGDGASLIIGALTPNVIPTNPGDYTIKWNNAATNGALFTM